MVFKLPHLAPILIPAAVPLALAERRLLVAGFVTMSSGLPAPANYPGEARVTWSLGTSRAQFHVLCVGEEGL